MNKKKLAALALLGISSTMFLMSNEGRAMCIKAATQTCKGKNDCKGMGNCKTDKHACNGKNDCKGQGGCKTTDANKTVDNATNAMAQKRANSAK